jgi:hypothetical protein
MRITKKKIEAVKKRLDDGELFLKACENEGIEPGEGRIKKVRDKLIEVYGQDKIRELVVNNRKTQNEKNS